MKKEQRCDYCGEDCGFFEYSRRDDGPLSCGRKECNREERADREAVRDDARARAEEDNYGRYGGGW